MPSATTRYALLKVQAHATGTCCLWSGSVRARFRLNDARLLTVGEGPHLTDGVVLHSQQFVEQFKHLGHFAEFHVRARFLRFFEFDEL